MTSPRRLIPLVASLLAAAALHGCSGCQESPPPPPPPTPAPVQGIAPAPAATAAVQAAEPQDICALLIFANTESGPAPFSAQFTAEGDCTDGQARFDWDFGDGSPGATGETVVHTFEKPGRYTVKARITSDKLPGVEDEDELEIEVEAADAAPKG